MSDEQLFPTSSENNAQALPQRKARNPVKSLLLALIFPIVGGLVGKGCVEVLFRADRYPKIDYVASTTTWQRYSPDGTQMSLELLDKPEQIPVKLSPQAQSNLLHYKSYELNQNELIVFTNYAEYKSGVSVSMDSAAISTLENMRGAKGLTNFHYSIGQRDPSETTFNGGLMLQNTDFEMNGFARGKGQKVLVVLVLSLRGHVGAKLSSERILNSATLN